MAEKKRAKRWIKAGKAIEKAGKEPEKMMSMAHKKSRDRYAKKSVTRSM